MSGGHRDEEANKSAVVATVLPKARRRAQMRPQDRSVFRGQCAWSFGTTMRLVPPPVQPLDDIYAETQPKAAIPKYRDRYTQHWKWSTTKGGCLGRSQRDTGGDTRPTSGNYFIPEPPATARGPFLKGPRQTISNYPTTENPGPQGAQAPFLLPRAPCHVPQFSMDTTDRFARNYPTSEVHRLLGPGSYDLPKPPAPRSHTMHLGRARAIDVSLLKEARSVGPGAYDPRPWSGSCHFHIPNIASYEHALGPKTSRRQTYSARRVVKLVGTKVQKRTMAGL